MQLSHHSDDINESSIQQQDLEHSRVHWTQLKHQTVWINLNILFADEDSQASQTVCSHQKHYDDYWVKHASSWTVYEDEERSESAQLQSHQYVFTYKNHQINSKTNIRRCFVHIVFFWSEVHRTKVTWWTSEDKYVIKVLKTSDFVLQNCSSQMNI